MATTHYYDAESSLVTLLRTNLTDPVGRGSRQWVYSGSPPEKGSRSVKIHVSRRGDVNPRRRIGSYNQDLEVNYLILVQVPLGKQGSVGGTDYSGTGLLNKICDDVASVMEDNASSISGVKYAQRVTSGGYYYNPDTKCYVAPMEYQFTIENN